jgi:hypothetical protein
MQVFFVYLHDYVVLDLGYTNTDAKLVWRRLFASNGEILTSL